MTMNSSNMEAVLAKEWFYSYELPDGSCTATTHNGTLNSIHDTRWSMLQAAIKDHLVGDLQKLSAIDLACHQGYFAIKLVEAGLGQVHAVDARQNHVDDTRLIADVYGHSQLSTQQSDVFDLDVEKTGDFDLVLMLGLLYHLENPVGALRIARKLCRNLCVIETQVVPGITGYVDYGSYEFVRPLKGSFGVIDETDDTHGPEASITGICLVPSLEALVWTLHKVGFSEVSVLTPPADAYEQLLHHKRVMVVAKV